MSQNNNFAYPCFKTEKSYLVLYHPTTSQYICRPEVCMDWILDFLDPDSGCFQQDQEWGFLSHSRMRIEFGFYFYWKSVTGCLLDLYLPWLKQESDCLNLFGTGSGLDSDSQFAKQDWIRTQKNQSPNTSIAGSRKIGLKTARPGVDHSSH